MSWNFAIHSFAIIPCKKRTTNVLMRLCRLVCTLVVSKQGVRLSLDNLETTLIGPDKEFFLRENLIIFLPINLNMCFGCSKELSDWDGSFEYPQHMFWMRNKENIFSIRTLIWRPVVYFKSSIFVQKGFSKPPDSFLWTREWSDWMYGQAVQVFPAHKFNFAGFLVQSFKQ